MPESSASTRHPSLSVVMPVHDALPHLDEAVTSILGQSFADFEFVILDDASSDGSRERLRHWASRDTRIRLIEVERNLGPALSSERVAQEARGTIVARMDADDVSHPDRLRQQLAILLERADVGLVACLCDLVDGDGRKLRGPDLWRLARRSWMAPFPHGAMMYRRELFERVDGYRRECEYWEDQDLITRMGAASKIMVIPAPLYRVRQTAASTRSTAKRSRQERALDSMYRQLADLGAGGGASGPRDERIDPRVFLSLGSVILWSGERPRLFTRLLRHGKLSPGIRSLIAIAWTGWASTSPGSLRAALRMVGGLRNLVARTRIDVTGPVLWSQPAIADPGAVRSSGRPVRRGSAAGRSDSASTPAVAQWSSASASRKAHPEKVSR